MFYNCNTLTVVCISADTQYTVNGVVMTKEEFDIIRLRASYTKNDVYYDMKHVYGTRISAADIHHTNVSLTIVKRSNALWGVRDELAMNTYRPLKERILNRHPEYEYIINPRVFNFDDEPILI